jgi:predicted MPP superfamily phosphohydrolase
MRVLLNERIEIEREGERVHIAGIDDAHFFASDSIERAAEGIPAEEFVLLSHTPEVYREAERAGFDAMLSGHMHGGQISLPGGIAITLDASFRGIWERDRGDTAGFMETASPSARSKLLLAARPSLER